MPIILNMVTIPSGRVFCFALLIHFVTLVASITAPYGQQPQTPRESVSVAQRAPGPAPEQLKAEEQQLTNEKLRIEIEKLQLESTNSIRNPFTFRGLINLLYENGAIIGAVFIGAWGFYKYLGERQKERLRREEERFEQIVKSLGSEQAQERVGAAVSLPTFLHPEYERFYIQVFNLAAGNLRIPTKEPSQRAVAQALVTVLRDSYPRARNLLARRKSGESVDTERSLNAAGVHMGKSISCERGPCFGMAKTGVT